MQFLSRGFALPAILPAMFFANVVHAEEIYVFGGVGVTETTHSIERNLGANPPALPVPDAGGVSTVSESDVSFLLGAGARTNIAQGPVFVGVEGYFSFEEAGSRNINGVLVTDLELQARYGARALLGADVTDKFSVYGHGGIAFVDYDLTNSYTFAPPVRERSNDDSGFSYGVGASYRVTDQISVFTDYTKVTQIEFDGIPEVAGGTGRINRNTLALDTVSTGIRLSF